MAHTLLALFVVFFLLSNSLYMSNNIKGLFCCKFPCINSILNFGFTFIHSHNISFTRDTKYKTNNNTDTPRKKLVNMMNSRLQIFRWIISEKMKINSAHMKFCSACILISFATTCLMSVLFTTPPGMYIYMKSKQQNQTNGRSVHAICEMTQILT